MRRSVTPIVCALTLLTVAAVAAGPAIGQPTVADRETGADATVAVGEDTVAPGSTATVPVSLSVAPGGLAGYNVTVRVADPEAATIVDASVSDAYGLVETRVIDGGAAVILRAADTSDSVTPGDENVRFGSVTLRGETAGETELRVEVGAVDDDGGDRVDPRTDAGTLRVVERRTPVSETPTTTASTTEPPETTTAPTAEPPETTTTPTTESPETTTAPTAEPPETTTAPTAEPPETTTNQPTTGPPSDPTETTETTETTVPDGTTPGDRTASATSTATAGTTAITTEDGQPGFGVVIVLAALATLAVVRRRH